MTDCPLDLTFVYVDRLREGKRVSIEGSLPPSAMDVKEKELKFEAPITVEGEAYLADQELIIQLSAHTEALMPCAVCNEWVAVPISLERFYEAVPLADIKGRIFDWTPLMREELLLLLPNHVECSVKGCPKRKEIAPFLKDSSSDDEQRPFADL